MIREHTPNDIPSLLVESHFLWHLLYCHLKNIYKCSMWSWIYIYFQIFRLKATLSYFFKNLPFWTSTWCILEFIILPLLIALSYFLSLFCKELCLYVFIFCNFLPISSTSWILYLICYLIKPYRLYFQYMFY